MRADIYVEKVELSLRRLDATPGQPPQPQPGPAKPPLPLLPPTGRSVEADTAGRPEGILSLPTVLEVEGLQVAYGDVQALWDVSFEVPARGIVTLLGANGAGKTTTLRAVSGLLRPGHGSMRFEGRSLVEMAPHAIVALGISHIPEGRHIWAGMSVRENLELGAFPRPARPKMRESLDWVLQLFPRLAERRAQLAGTLSGGEQQMLAIGRALMARPRLLMLDEPSLGLAPLAAAELFQTIASVNATGVAVLLVEQNVHQALRVAQRGYVLETGRIVLAGSARDLIDDPYIREAYLGL